MYIISIYFFQILSHTHTHTNIFFLFFVYIKKNTIVCIFIDRLFRLGSKGVLAAEELLLNLHGNKNQLTDMKHYNSMINYYMNATNVNDTNVNVTNVNDVNVNDVNVNDVEVEDKDVEIEKNACDNLLRALYWYRMGQSKHAGARQYQGKRKKYESDWDNSDTSDDSDLYNDDDGNGNEEEREEEVQNYQLKNGGIWIDARAMTRGVATITVVDAILQMHQRWDNTQANSDLDIDMSKSDGSDEGGGDEGICDINVLVRSKLKK